MKELPATFVAQFHDRLGAFTVRDLADMLATLRSHIEPTRILERPQTYEDRVQLRANVLAYRQMLLHRSLELFRGTIHAAEQENLYSMVLNIRGHFEATAALGYLAKRLSSRHNGHLSLTKLAEDIAALMLGTRTTMQDLPPAPKQVMTMLDEADAIAAKLHFPSNKKILRESYEFLCEFAHPNFHSNATSFDLDKTTHTLIFRYGKPMRPSEDKLIEYILISAGVFCLLFERMEDLIPG